MIHRTLALLDYYLIWQVVLHDHLRDAGRARSGQLLKLAVVEAVENAETLQVGDQLLSLLPSVADEQVCEEGDARLQERGLLLLLAQLSRFRVQLRGLSVLCCLLSQYSSLQPLIILCLHWSLCFLGLRDRD